MKLKLIGHVTYEHPVWIARDARGHEVLRAASRVKVDASGAEARAVAARAFGRAAVLEDADAAEARGVLEETYGGYVVWAAEDDEDQE